MNQLYELLVTAVTFSFLIEARLCAMDVARALLVMFGFAMFGFAMCFLSFYIKQSRDPLSQSDIFSSVGSWWALCLCLVAVESYWPVAVHVTAEALPVDSRATSARPTYDRCAVHKSTIKT